MMFNVWVTPYYFASACAMPTIFVRCSFAISPQLRKYCLISLGTVLYMCKSRALCSRISLTMVSVMYIRQITPPSRFMPYYIVTRRLRDTFFFKQIFNNVWLWWNIAAGTGQSSLPATRLTQMYRCLRYCVYLLSDERWRYCNIKRRFVYRHSQVTFSPSIM